MEKIRFIKNKSFDILPKTAGVYLFYENKEIIYIGKAINIKDRVKNHFHQPSYRDNLFIEKVNKIGFIDTDSEIEALILEASLIRKYQPKFNVVWKDGKNYFYVAIERNQLDLPFIYITHQPRGELKPKSYKLKARFIGPFVEGNALKKALKYLRRVFPYYTTKSHPKNQCTWCHLGLCPGPNPDLASYKNTIKKLILILKGRRKTVLYSLKKEMESLSKLNKFEEAAKIRDKINALSQVMAHTHVIEEAKIQNDKWHSTNIILQGILNLNKNVSKIECYDISNIQGKNAVGSMVVFTNGAPDKSQYKKFRIRMENEPNDIAMLKEVFLRRFNHPEWQYPEIMLIDGGKAQLNAAIEIKNIKSETKQIKIISIAKGRQELFIEGRKKPIPLKALPQDLYNLVKHLDDEAHRFAITFHKKLRKKALGLDKNI